MRGSEHWLDICMDLRRRDILFSFSVVALVLLFVSCGVQSQSDDSLAFEFFESPPSITRNTTAVFRWGVVAPNGSDPCAVQECVNQCKIDDGPFQNCSSRYAVYQNLSDGVHVFTILVSTMRGHFFPNETTWTVDTTPPTAIVTAGASFTNAVNISVGIEFSEPCVLPNGGLQCPNVSACDVYVNGLGVVIPSTLTVIKPGLDYSITVALSSVNISGKAQVTLRKQFCSDAAGNPFSRNRNASFTVRFDRSTPTLNMWTPIQESQVQINNQYMTISATNTSSLLMINLDFSESMDTNSPNLSKLIQLSHGILTSASNKTDGNRRFKFKIENVSDFAIVSVSLPPNSFSSRYGSPVLQTANVTFLYDSIRPGVILSTTSLAKTKNHLVPFLIQFTEPVFLFDATNVNVSGGNLTRFDEVSKSTYTFEVYIFDDDTVSVKVEESVTYDISGNPNLPSNHLEVRHYTEPSFAVALYSFTTAGLIATALASGALSISSATLAAAGALTSRTSGSIGSDPSRNLLGMASNLQVFALSEWLAVSLPVEYRETTRGLRWLIPHVNPPWQEQPNSSALNNPLLQQQVDPSTPMVKSITHARRRVLDDDIHSFKYRGFIPRDPSHLGMDFEAWQPTSVSPCKSRFRRHSKQRWIDERSASTVTLNMSHVKCTDHLMPFRVQGAVTAEDGVHYKGRRRLDTNSSLYGPALGPNDYALYFQSGASNAELESMFNKASYTGWRDFARNMFWVGAVGGGVILLHLLLLLFLRWRSKTSVRGALTVPRFELFLLLLAIPAMCQASAFIIRGSTTLGIIIGVLLLAVPAAFLLSVVIFLIVAIFMGSLVQYKEVVRQPSEDEERPWRSKEVELLAGPNSIAKWVRKDGLASTFLPRYGLLFEDRKGPPKLIVLDSDVGGSFPKWIDSGSNGIGRMRAVNSDDESEEVTVPRMQKLLGGARAAYIVVDIARRIALGVFFGAFARSDSSWIQVSLALGVTVVQLLYLIILKPFIKRGMQVVETISLLCQTGLFVTALVLLWLGSPSHDRTALGILLIALMLLSFVAQLVNEWYALMKQLLRLSPSQEPSLKVGLKMLARGIVLPFVPRRHWGRFITPQPPEPRTGLVPVVPMSPEQPEIERARRSTSVHTGSPLMAIGPEPALPGYDPGSPAFIDPRNVVTEDGIMMSGEIKPDSSPVAPAAAAAVAAAAGQRPDTNKPNTNWGSQWSRSRSMEGKRSTRGTKSDPKSNEMKMLRDIAKASFPRWRKHEEISDPGLEISSPVTSNLGTGAGVGRKLSSSAPSRVGVAEEQGYTDDSGSDNSSDDERFGRRPQVVGESSVDVIGGPSRGITPHSSSSFEKGSKGSGPLETTLSGGSLPVRELVQER